MKSNYQIAFKVEVVHSYFEQGICTCLQFKPGAVSMQLLKRFGLVIKECRNGFEFYTNTQSSLSEYLAYIKKTTAYSYFDFDIATNNASFTLFTELPTNKLGQLCYDTQSASNKYIDGIMQLSMLYAEGTSISSTGSLIVRFEDLLNLTEVKGYTSFNITYKARATQWQYFVINRNAVQLDNPAVTGKANIGFNGPRQVTIESGEPAMLFSSGDTLIPLSYKPVYKFDLVNNPAPGDKENARKNAAKVILKGLPNPDPARLGFTGADNDGVLTSPMYVYV